jgi:hypothetical protein
MEFYSKKSNTTPYVSFKDGILEMSGKSIPENPREVFDPLLNVFNEYSINPLHKTVLNFEFEYVNSSTSRCLMNLLGISEKIAQSGKEVTVNWYYEKNDEDIYDLGENMKELINVPFNLLEMN